MSVFDSWDKVEAFALSLPGTVRSTIYNMPMVMISKNRRGFLVTGHEAQTSFAVPLDEGYAEMLMEPIRRASGSRRTMPGAARCWCAIPVAIPSGCAP